VSPDPSTTLLDSCVLYPAQLRSLFLYLATAGLFRARWTDSIHEEWIRTLVQKHPDVTRAKAERIRDLMNAAVPDSLVAGLEHLCPTLTLPDPDDRHVLAAAIHSGAGVIVTFNLSDFPVTALSPHHVEAVHPDEFLLRLLTTRPIEVCGAVARQRLSLKNPPKTVDEFLAVLQRCQLPLTVSKLRAYAERL
jgi:predicted nucleic acid-binding protein